jgi:hypothetical protein
MEYHPSTQIVQTLDIENNCTGVFLGNKFFFEQALEAAKNCKWAWKHSPILNEEEFIYLNIYLKNKQLSEYSTNHLQMTEVENLLESQKKAAMLAKLDFSEMCFFDAIPDHLMNKWFSARHSALLRVINTVRKPSDYDILHKIHVLVTNISKQKIIVNNCPEVIKYDIFSSATGRLATERGSFSILNISKEERVNITPQNDMFLELDLNGAEIRTLLALSGKHQPDHDIHEYNKEVLASVSTRKETKARFFAWLYNPEAIDKELEKLYNKNVYKKHYKNGYITTPFDRKLEVDERKALNYLTQSTTSDIVLENSYKIMKFLKGKKSFVAFTMHDSVVLDFCKEDHGLVQEIKNIFETNMFGKFLSTVSIGKNYGNLKEIKI